MKKLIVIVLLMGIGIITIWFGMDSKSRRVIYQEGIVKDIVLGDSLILDNDKTVDLAGIEILTEGINFRPELIKNIKDLLQGKKIRYRIITKAGKRYPKYPLVEAYLEDGKFINEELLSEGMAFYDHGYYAAKTKFEGFQLKAQKNKKGIWNNINPPQVLYIGSRSFEAFHYPECEEVKRIKDDKKIFYYFAPSYIWGYRGFDPHCRSCKLIENGRMEWMNGNQK